MFYNKKIDYYTEKAKEINKLMQQKFHHLHLRLRFSPQQTVMVLLVRSNALGGFS